MKLEIIGVYPVENAKEPCHLMEWRVSDYTGSFDVGLLIQPIEGQLKERWQSAYNEHVLSAKGDSGNPVFGPFEVHGEARFCFFFHYLKSSVPFETPVGKVLIPHPITRPDRLEFVNYEMPC